VSRRILTTIVGIAALAVVCFGIPLALSVRRTQQDDAITTLEREAARAALEAPATASNRDPIELPAPLAGDVLLAVYDQSGARLIGTGPDRADAVTASALSGALSTSTSGPELVVGWPLTANEITYGSVRAALPREAFESKVHRAWGLMAALGLLVIAVAAGLAWRQARRLAQPVAMLTTAVEHLGAGDFSVSVPPSGVAELDHAGRALEFTAARLGGVLEREREFSANASHQLRTPLTGLRLTLELAAADDRAPRKTIDAALASVDRLEATIDDLLRLARDVTHDASTDLPPIIEDQERTWHGAFAANGRPLRVIVADDLPVVTAPPNAVRQILDVLLSNAFDHGGGVVTLTANATPGGAVIEVTDEGAGVDGDTEAVFSRRVGRGTGIGLALARSLAAAEGGRLVLRAPGPSPTFRLLLPAVPGKP